VERIVSVFRKHYDIVEYVVPNYAYSASTILVLSGDEIYLDYYSVLGPIDPQMEDEYCPKSPTADFDERRSWRHDPW
jgi:ClpP class serine protease